MVYSCCLRPLVVLLFSVNQSLPQNASDSRWFEALEQRGFRQPAGRGGLEEGVERGGEGQSAGKSGRCFGDGAGEGTSGHESVRRIPSRKDELTQREPKMDSRCIAIAPTGGRADPGRREWQAAAQRRGNRRLDSRAGHQHSSSMARSAEREH